jgi:Protein of unknown function with HXXEE motif
MHPTWQRISLVSIPFVLLSAEEPLLANLFWTTAIASGGVAINGNNPIQASHGKTNNISNRLHAAASCKD